MDPETLVFILGAIWLFGRAVKKSQEAIATTKGEQSNPVRPSGARLVLTLTDFGGVPVLFDFDRGTLIQVVAANPNAYKPGDVFKDPYGSWWRYSGNGQMANVLNGATVPVGMFTAHND